MCIWEAVNPLASQEEANNAEGYQRMTRFTASLCHLTFCNETHLGLSAINRREKKKKVSKCKPLSRSQINETRLVLSQEVPL